jgi:hypothetical protein
LFGYKVCEVSGLLISYRCVIAHTCGTAHRCVIAHMCALAIYVCGMIENFFDANFLVIAHMCGKF